MRWEGDQRTGCLRPPGNSVTRGAGSKQRRSPSEAAHAKKRRDEQDGGRKKRSSPITQFIRARPRPDGLRGLGGGRVHGAAAAPRAQEPGPRRARVPRREPGVPGEEAKS